MAYQTSTNHYQTTKYIVDATAGATPYATIQSAINAANAAGIPATVFIRPGAYTENLTLYSQIDLEGSENSEVSITGKHTPPNAGSLNFNRVGFVSATHVLDSAAAGTTVIKFSRCLFAVANGYICNLTNWTGAISFKYCTDASTNNGVITNTAAAPVNIYNAVVGAGTGNTMTINGITEIFNGKVQCPLTIAGSSTGIFEGACTFNGTITTGGTVAVKIRNSTISTGAAAAISHGSGTALLLNNVVIDSTKTSYCIEGTGSVQFNEATFVNSKSLAGTITEVLTGVVKTGEIYADTILRMEMSGFYSWAAGAPYFDDTTLGTFQLLVGGTGYIKGKLVTWVAQNIAGMTSGATWWIYIDSTGTIGKTSSRTDALFVNNIVLFECLYDETLVTKQQHTARENHPYSYEVSVSNYLHDTVGGVIENANNGANIVAGTTNVRISISGDDVLSDHGLETTITAGTDKTWKKFYKNAGGKWAVDATGTDFAGRYNNAGTPTNITAGKYAVYTLYVGKDSGNTATPVYYAVLDSTQYSNSGAASSAIAAGTTSKADGELAALELAQLGYIVQGPNTAGPIAVITISKSTLRSTISGGAGSSVASGVTTNTASFNGILSAADTNVQAALDTIDNWGASTTDHALLIGNGTGSAIGSLAVGATGEVVIGTTGADASWSSAVTLAAGGSLQTALLAGNTLLVQAYDVDGTVYVPFITLTANNTPTCDLASAVTIGSAYIYRGSGTDVAVADGGTGLSTLTAHALYVGNGASAPTALAVGATGEILVGATGADCAWLAAGDANKVLTAHGAGNAVTWEAPGAGATWMTKANAAADATATVNYAYTINHATPANLLTLTLPATAAVGDRVEIVGNTAGMWKLVAAGGDTIKLGGATTSAGGYLAATTRYDCVEVVCTVADTTWVVCSATGNLTIA